MENTYIVIFCVAYTCMTLFESFETIPTGICGGRNGTSCCFGFKWDLIQEKCISCGKGYWGTNCQVKCPFPAYGVGCQMECNCIDKECDPVNGCKRSTTGFPITSLIGWDNKMVTTKLLESTVSISEICEKGYNGANCETRCPYPSYGLGCQQHCNCIDKDCNYVSGCMRSADHPTPSSTNIEHKTATTEFLRPENNTYYPDNTPQNDGTTTCRTWNKERKQKKILTFALIGLLIVSAIIVFAFFYTRLLEKRFIVTRIV